MADIAPTFDHPGHLIGGDWVRGSGGELTSCNPARPSDLVATFNAGTRSDLELAVTVALAAQGNWETMGSIARGVILRKVADLMEDRREALAALMTREQGKTLAESLGEVDGSVETIRYHAAKGRDSNGRTFPSSFPGEHIETVRQALGVVAVITPWNFPTQIPAWKIAPALLWGNTVVWKPAGDIPAISFAFAQVFHDAGMPAGVFNMVLAPGSVAQSLVDDPRIAGITFTGSVPVGKQIASSATSRGVKVQLNSVATTPQSSCLIPTRNCCRAVTRWGHVRVRSKVHGNAADHHCWRYSRTVHQVFHRSC